MRVWSGDMGNMSVTTIILIALSTTIPQLLQMYMKTRDRKKAAAKAAAEKAEREAMGLDDAENALLIEGGALFMDADGNGSALVAEEAEEIEVEEVFFDEGNEYNVKFDAEDIFYDDELDERPKIVKNVIAETDEEEDEDAIWDFGSAEFAGELDDPPDDWLWADED